MRPEFSGENNYRYTPPTPRVKYFLDIEIIILEIEALKTKID